MKALDNLVSIHQLKNEAPDAAEFAGYVAGGEQKIIRCANSGFK